MDSSFIMDNTLDSNLSLPKNADPTGAVQDIESTQQQDSTELFTISQLSEKTAEQTDLPSPRSRKRHSDEVYQKVDKPVTTTPQKTPPRKSIANFRQQSVDLSHASHASVGAASSNLRSVLNMQSSPSTALPPSNQETQSTQRTTASQTTTFVDELNTYQRDLDNQYERFASELERRDRQADLEDYDWDALETRYRNEVKPLLEDEDRIKKELGQRLQVGRSDLLLPLVY